MAIETTPVHSAAPVEGAEEDWQKCTGDGPHRWGKWSITNKWICRTWGTYSYTQERSCSVCGLTDTIRRVV